MPRPHPPYPEPFRAQLIALVRAGRTPEELAREFEPTAQTIRNWLAAADLATESGSGQTSNDLEELDALRRENRQLRIEREILAKAAAWFARETEVTPHASTASSKRTRPNGR